MYKIFKRNWWRIENGKKVPNSGARGVTVKYVQTQREAIDYCTTNNANRPASWERLSKKYEWKGA
jgi:hypothetical protein